MYWSNFHSENLTTQLDFFKFFLIDVHIHKCIFIYSLFFFKHTVRLTTLILLSFIKGFNWLYPTHKWGTHGNRSRWWVIICCYVDSVSFSPFLFIRCVIVWTNSFIFPDNLSSVCLWSVNKKKPLSTVKRAHGCHGDAGIEQPHWVSSVAALQNSDTIASGAYSCEKPLHVLFSNTWTRFYSQDNVNKVFYEWFVWMQMYSVQVINSFLMKRTSK